MKSANLNQYAAVQAFASESTEGVSWEEIANAVGNCFDTPQDASNAAGTLLMLGYLEGVSYPKSENGKSCLLPDRVVGTEDGIAGLRTLRNTLGIIEQQAGVCSLGSLRRGLPAKESAAIGESVRQLAVMRILDIKRSIDGEESPADQLELCEK